MANSVPRRTATKQRTPDRYARPSAYMRGYNKRWQEAAAQYLAEGPLCVECERQGIVKQAECVDHLRPHRGDVILFWDITNWQSLCKRCHDKKTASGQ